MRSILQWVLKSCEYGYINSDTSTTRLKNEVLGKIFSRRKEARIVWERLLSTEQRHSFVEARIGQSTDTRVHTSFHRSVGMSTCICDSRLHFTAISHSRAIHTFPHQYKSPGVPSARYTKGILRKGGIRSGGRACGILTYLTTLSLYPPP